ncbi:hypothetical protein IAU59_006787 [Kwoniella sp. CBS 9459]
MINIKTSSLIALAPALTGMVALGVRAQAPDASSGAASFNPNDPSTWPQWITNDYNCVINCLSGFSDQVTTIPQPDMEKQAFSCASTNCEGDGTGNYYQTLYYIQLFYATGSIYEWADSAPDGYKHAAFLDNQTAGDQQQQQAQQSASDVLATASEPWDDNATSSPAAGTGAAAVVPSDAAGTGAGAAEATGSSAGATGGEAQSPGATASGTGGTAGASSSSASVKGATPTTGSAAASGTGKNGGAGTNSTGNSTGGDGNGSSGAVPAIVVGLGLGAGVQGALAMGVAVVVAGFSGVWLGL